MTKAVHISTVLAFFLFSISPSPAFAFHVRVVEGNATISKSGKTITITDTGNTPLILKGRLNIPAGTTVDIVGADVLLRSATHQATSILGDLFSTGDVVIVNPYGVYLGTSANINVSGIIVSTLNISTQSFINGTYQFTKVPGLNPAEVLNAANITTAPGGYVVLLADRIVNKGAITAYMGSVALGSGSQATVSFDQSGFVNLVIDKGLAQQLTDSNGNPKAQIVNRGTITADGGKVELSAQLLQTALNDTVNNIGKIVATSVVNNGGDVELLSSGGINNSGTIDATNLTEQGETFDSSGTLDVGTGFFTNLDGAMNISGGINGTYEDTGNIVFTGDVSLGDEGVTLYADYGGGSGGGEILMEGYSITGNDEGLNLYASQSSDSYDDTLNGSISGVAQLGFYSSSGNNETFTSTGATFSVNTVYTNSNALFSRSQGNGSMGTPYMIYSDSNAIGGLAYINTNSTTLGYYYELANNINASDTDSGAGFLPIGTGSAPFTGNFNGNSKTISDLDISRSSNSDIGLFGYTSSATIDDLTLSNVNITGDDNVGAFVGYAVSSTVSSDNDSGSVSGAATVGGLVGENDGGTVSSGNSSSSVIGTGNNVGGLAGYNTGMVSNSYSTGTVSGSNNVGGLAGYNTDTVSNGYSTGTVSGNAYVGGIVGYNFDGTVSSDYVYGNVTATATNSYVGGLVGENAFGGTVEDSYVGNNDNSTNTVSGNVYTGGLVGYNSSSTLETSYTSVFVSVSGTSDVGGLVGENSAGTINTDYNFADVTATGNDAGGIAGYNASAGIIENTFSLGTVSGSSGVGGLVGENNGSTIEYSYATGSASGSSDAGGLIGINAGGSTVEDSFAIGTASSSSDSNATAGGLIGDDDSSNTNTNDWWYSSNTYGIGNTSAAGNEAGAQSAFFNSGQSVYSGWDISSSQSHIWAMSGNDDALPLLQFRYSTSITDTYQLQLMFLGLSATYTIDNEIYAAESQNWNEGLGFEPIGSSGSPFTGTLNGNNQEIDDFYIDRSSASDVGLFSYTDGADIHNIDLYNSNITGGNETGALVGQDTAGSTVSSNYFQEDTISGGNYTGGIEGEADSGGTLDSNTYKDVTVSGTDDVGGILGAGTSTTVNSNTFDNDNDVDISGTSYVGGMVGDCSSCTVDSNYAGYGHADSSGSYDGGIVGYQTSGTINSDETDDDFSVSGGDYTGGVAGYNTGTISESGDNGGSVSGGNYTGGVAGYNTGSMSDDYANFSSYDSSHYGSVSGDFYVGGIAGYTSGNIENSEVGYGSVTGVGSVDYTGGVAGYNNGGTLYQDYADGSVSGGAYVGGLVGDNTGGSISQSYAIGPVSGTNQVGGLVGENESSSSIANSSALGNVTATGNNAGGLVGLNSGSTIQKSFAVGTVSAVHNAGGLVGDNVGTSTVEDSFATGTATSTGDSDATAGGLVGDDDNSNTLTNDWWYNPTDIAAVGNSPSDASLSSEVSKAASASVFLNPEQSVYSSWDISTSQDTSHVWAMSPDDDVLPLLQFAYTTDVYDLYQLQMMFLNLGADYYLENNIPATGVANWNAYQGFVSIGGSSAFTGNFDGDNDTISNLTIDPSVLTDDVGLFGQTDEAYIHNLDLSQVSVTGSEYVGAFAGYLISSTINDDGTTNSSSSVSGSSNDVGGLVGYASGSTIENSSSTGTVSGAAQVGGVVGYNTAGSINSDSSSSTVTGTGNNVGGLAGENNNSTINNSSASGTVTSSTGTNVGGLVGDNLNSNSTINNSNATGDVTGETMVGGLAGYNEANITSSYAQGNADGSGNDVGGLVGYNSSATINNSYATGTATGVSYVGGLLGYNSDGEVYNNSYASGSISASGSYAGGLIGENNGGNIDNTNASTTVTVSGSGDYAGGLIGYNTGSSTIDSSYATGTVSAASVSYVGGLVGYNDANTVEDSYATGSVSGSEYVGGLVGYDTGSSPVEFSYATGSITAASDDDGGLIGENNGNLVAYSYAQGNVSSSGNNVGGFIGYNLGASLIEIDYATGSVTAASSTDVGGFIGNNTSSSTVMIDYATGNVTGGTNVGGLIGNNNGSGGLSYSYATGPVGAGSIAGGLVGLNSGSSISNSYATGDITDSGADAGGLVGENTSGAITNTYATGTANGTGKVGGLIGYNLSSSTVTNSFATGTATSGGDTAGGLVGNDDNSNTFTNDWWYNATNTAAVGNSPSDASLSSEVSKAVSASAFYSTAQAVFNGSGPWDFIGVWKTTATYPELFFQYYNTWTNFDGNNDWNDAGDWMDDSVPSSSTNVLFNFFNTNNSFNDADGQVSSLVIDAVYTGTITENTGLTDTGIFNQYGGTYNANGQSTAVSGLTTLAGGTYEAGGNTQTFNGGLTVSGGTFTGSSGTIYTTTVILSSGTLTAPSAPFYVSGAWDVSGGTFTPGGNTVTFDTSTADETITTGDQGFSYVDFDPSGSGSYTLESALTTANDLTISSGTLNAEGYAINVGGNWDNAGTFTPDGDTVTFTSTSTGQTITSNGDDFYNVSFDGTDGSWILQDALGVTNNLSISAGTLDTNSGNNYGITVGGNWTETGGGFTAEDGTVTFDGTGTQEFSSGGSSFYGITHSGSGTLQLTGSGLTVTHNFTNSAGTFDLNGQNWTMTGANFSNNDGTVEAQGGETVTGLTMDSTHGNVVYYGTGNYTGLALGNAYNNLTFDGSGTWTLNNTLTTSKNLTIDDDNTFNANGKAISVGGNWDNAGTFTPDGDTVTFTSTSTGQTITSGGDDFYNISFNGASGSWILQDALGVTNNLSISAGTLDTNSGNNYGITVGGNWTETGGGFTAEDGTVTFDGSGTQEFNSGGSSFYGITHSGSGTLQLTGSSLTVTHDLTNSPGTFDLNGENWTMTGASFSNNDGTVKAQGGETVTGLTMDSTYGNVIYDGAGNYTGLPLGNAYNNLTFDGSGSWGLSGALTIGNDLTITSGTLIANGYAITVSGNWDNAGTFTADGDTVTFDNSSQTISGNTTFGNLTDIASGTGLLTFQAGSTQTITGDLTLEGGGLSLLSSSPGSSWFIDPQGLRTIEAFRVQDSDNIDPLAINTDGFNVVDLGDDINWIFPVADFTFPIEITQDGSGSSSNNPSNNIQIQTAGDNSYGGMTDTDDGQYVFLGSWNNSTPVVSTPDSGVNQGYVNPQGTSWLNSISSYIQSNWNIQTAGQVVQGADGFIGLEPGSGTDNNPR